MEMLDRLVHLIGSKMDSQQKRYNAIIGAQQQQISELSALIVTLVNDHHNHAESQRDKLSGALHGLTSLAASIGDTIHTGARYGASHGMEADNFFGEILGNGDNSSGQNSKINGGGRGPYDQQYEGNGNNEGSHRENETNESRSNNNPGGPSSDNRQFNQTLIGYDDFGQLNAQPGRDHAGRPQMHDRSLYQSSVSQNNHPGAVVSNERHHQTSDPNGEIDTGMSEEQYLNIAGRKRKRSVFMGNFQFLKSPHSVMDIWKEYTEGINGQPSIKEMESLYQTGWRRDPAVNKRYSRRRVLCKAIETGLSKGYSLEETVNLLEDCRVIDHEKGLKQPIGWLCQGHSIPDELR